MGGVQDARPGCPRFRIITKSQNTGNCFGGESAAGSQLHLLDYNLYDYDKSNGQRNSR